MIYDCFLFHSELELLELRLMELEDSVDIFVLCESEKTFRGKPKPLHFAENKVRFLRWLPKIRYVYCPGFENENPWLNEWAQRDFLARGLGDASTDDVIMLSDVDEIPRSSKIPESPPDRPLIFQQRLYYYYVNCLQGQEWWGTMAGSLESLLPFSDQRPGDLYRKRQQGLTKKAVDADMVMDAGWHFSFLGGPEKIVEKIESYSEERTDTEEFKDESHLRHCLDTGADLFGRKGRDFEKIFVPLNESFPDSINRWLDKYPHMYKEVHSA